MKHLQQLLDDIEIVSSKEGADYIHNWYKRLSDTERILANDQLKELDELGWLVLCINYIHPIVYFGWFFPDEYDELVKGSQLEGKTIYRNSTVKLRTMVLEDSKSNKKVPTFVDILMPYFVNDKKKKISNGNRRVLRSAYSDFKKEMRTAVGVYNLY